MSALTQAMREYADAMRRDWSGFDGRSEKLIILGWVEEIENPSERTLEEWRVELGICLDGNGHWVDHCTPERCPITLEKGWI